MAAAAQTESKHPLSHRVQVICTCGQTFEIGSTLAAKEYRLEQCNKCHPVYTKVKKTTVTEGRAQQFASKYSKLGKTPVAAAPVVAEKKPAKPRAKKTTTDESKNAKE